MKKIINSPERVVAEMLRGMELAPRGLVRGGPDAGGVVRPDAPVQNKVALVSGGGSGHEPAHGGYVGPGMLDAACAGNVFTSPTPEQMLEASKAVDGGAGVFYVVKNYTGDVLNFEMAGELAEAEGIQTDYVVTNDDVAVEDSTFTSGRRGIAGTLFVHKICGAAADDGKDLAGIKELAERVNGNVRSMGMALTSCTPPESGEPICPRAADAGGRGAGAPGGGGAGPRGRALDGCAADQVPPSGGRRAHLPERRRRDGDGRRHPRRARHRAQKDRACGHHRGPDAREDPRRLSGLLGRRGRRDGKRHGRQIGR